MSWSPDGRRLASGGDDGKIRIWDPATRKEVLTLEGHDRSSLGAIRADPSLAWSPDGHRLASAGLDGTAKVWDAGTGREVFALPADHGAVWSVALSPDGTHLAAGSEDGTIRVRRWARAHSEGLLLSRPIKVMSRTLAWSPRGDRLASGGADKLVKLWDPIHGVEHASMQGHKHCSHVGVVEPGRQAAGVGLRRHGRHRMGCGDRSELSTMRGHNDFVDAVAWSPDGTRLASASIDDTVRVWDPRTGEEALVLRGNSGMFHDVSWHPDGAQLAAASSDGHVWIWDATLGFERDTTPRALPFLDRKIASGTARGEDVRFWVDLAEYRSRRRPLPSRRSPCSGSAPWPTRLTRASRSELPRCKRGSARMPTSPPAAVV